MRTTRLLIIALLGLGTAVAPAAPATSAPPDDTVPTLTITDVRWQRFYPADDGYRDLGQVSYDISDPVDTTLQVHMQVTDAAGTLVRETGGTHATPSSLVFGWDGRDDAGTPAPAGDYTFTLWATDAEKNASLPESRTLTLDRGKLVTRTYRRDITARQSVVERDVRRCATMPSPVRGWEGSLGYYSGTRCNATGTPSVAATVNGIRVPEAFQDGKRSYYGTVVVKTWGGNARNRAGSKSVLQYWNRKDESWFAAKVMGSRLTSHAGRKKPATPMVYPNDGQPYIIWSLLTMNGHWYDVKKFSVVVNYQVMEQPAIRETAERVPAVPVTPRDVPAVR